MKNNDFKRKLNLLNKINIALIGHMGSGKSIIGKIMSKKLSLDHCDSDSEIVNLEKETISNIFENKGEKYFRKVETQILLKLLNKKNTIISLGGGSILDSHIRNKLKKNSVTVFLDVRLEELIKRLNKSRVRPLLKNTNIRLKLKELDIQRRRYYLNADIRIQHANTVNQTYLNFVKIFTSLND